MFGTAGGDVIINGDWVDSNRYGAFDLDDIFSDDADDDSNMMWSSTGNDTFVFTGDAGDKQILGFEIGVGVLDFSELGFTLDDLTIEGSSSGLSSAGKAAACKYSQAIQPQA